MAKRRKSEQTIFFPWERPLPIFRGLGLGRARPIIAALLFAGIFVVLGVRERKRAGVRQTRATIGVVAIGLDAYRAEHEGKCPDDLNELTKLGYSKVEPRDAWGRPLRLLCPGFSHRDSYDLISDGPDGLFGGLDRVE